MRASLSVALACAALLTLGGGAAHAQSVTPQLSDPAKCVVILDTMGNVGFRISDAQLVADAVLTGMRKRVGQDGATYAGVAESAATMKRLLATPEGAGPQEAQLAWFKACEKAAPWRLRARFGVDKGKAKKSAPHWISLSCRKADADPKAAAKAQPVEERRFEAKTFLEARDQLAAAVPTFCGAIPSMAVIPVEGAPPGINGVAPRKKEPPKPWTPPPRRD